MFPKNNLGLPSRTRRSESVFAQGCWLTLLTLCCCILTVFSAHAEAECTQLTEGTPRGLQCLQCMHRRAKGHAERYTDVLLRSCRKNVAIAYSMDGAFGFAPSVITKQVNDLLLAGRNVTLHLYMLNGPAQRRWFKKSFVGFGNRIPPDVLRRKILTDRSFQNSYREFVERNLPVIDQAWRSGATISVSPMLEDNLTNAAFEKLLFLTQEAIPSHYNVAYVRNACSDCYPGNQFDIPDGILKEDHTFEDDFSQAGGYVSNDGTSYIYFRPDQKISIPKPVRRGARFEESIPLAALIPKLLRAEENDTVFLLWLNRFQSTLPGSDSAKINRRKFPVPTEFEVSAMADFLGT